MITTREADHAWRVGPNIFCPISDGAFAGTDVRTVIRQAVQWQKRELDAIESDAQRRSKGTGCERNGLVHPPG